jgi:hypothetical protein
LDTDYFRQIKLPLRRKADLVRAIMRYIAGQPSAVPRGKEFDNRFIEESSEPWWLKEEALADPWLAEHVTRIYWVCFEIGLLKYQYPYPHKGQTYRPTRAGRWVARMPTWPVSVLIIVTYVGSIIANPVKRFNQVRNVAAVATAGLLWWRQHDLSPVIILYASLSAGIISAWVASFLSSNID